MLCPNFVRDGFCDVPNCRHTHPDFVCDICGVICRTQKSFNAHIRGLQHATTKRSIARDPNNGPKKCTICDINLSSSGVERHVNSQDHQVRLRALRQAGQPIPPNNSIVNAEDRNYECLVCEIQVWETREAHEARPRHKRMEQHLSVRAKLEEAERDKNGVVVEPSGRDAFDLGLNPAGQASREIKITLEDPSLKVLLRSATLSGAKRGSCFSVDIQTNVYLPKTSSITGTVIFNSRGNRGRFQDRLELMFTDSTNNNKRFAIVKPMMCIVGDSEDYAILNPVGPYVPQTRRQREAVKELILGERPPALAAIKWTTRLKEYEIPKAMKTILDMPVLKEKARLMKSGFVPRELEPDTHTRHFHVLLHMEEQKSATDLERYDQENVTLKPREGLYYLDVPGLAEKRPSVIVGDRILVKEHGSPKPKWWEGYVYKVQLNDVGLRFNHSFPYISNQRFDIRFCLNRISLRRMHAALDIPTPNPRLLFPEEAHVMSRKPSQGTINTLTPFNRLVGSNPAQMIAVTAIRNLPEGSPPFVVFGPPGTGKTVTIIEAIRQILDYNRSSKILACAPSNSAADIIAERLTVLGPSQLFRLNAPSRSKDHLPAALKPFSRVMDNTFCVPPVEELRNFRVIVATCISAFVTHGIGLQGGHFSHVFVDEAGQACEPEALIGIKTMANSKTNLVLSGDPKQLGPIIRSDVALHFKFGVSLLDRLTEMPLYDDVAKAGVTIVKLVQNFRSHRTILKFPNERFYRGELECKADPIIIDSLLAAPVLAKPGFPVIFHAISGQDVREARSPSFFNVEEASLVKKYIQDLKENRRLQLRDEHIGVISPYNAQCGKIRQVIRQLAPGVKVGSVEEFQGQERRVIIISTVRSNLEFVQSDITHTLGFVANPRRFNVAITRAQALLIIIGDPIVLSLDPLWRSFLEYIYTAGGWKGVPVPDWDTDHGVDNAELLRSRRELLEAEQQQLMERITEVVERRAEAESLDNSGIGDGYEVVERPWREAE